MSPNPNLTTHSSKPILVTGAAGFIGARFVESCNLRGIPVISVDDLSAFDSRTEHQAAGVNFGKKFSIEEALDLSVTGKLSEISAIVHMGACSSTTEMNVDFLRKVNIEYSQTLWELARARKIPFVYASSAATYGEGELGYDDDESRMKDLKPLNPYGDSKRLFDLWALQEDAAGRAPEAWSGFKFFNVYGFGEKHKGGQASVVNHAFAQIQASGVAKLFRSHREGIADGEQKRDFIFVDDVVKVLHFALEKPVRRGIFNLGTGQARTFLDLVRAVFKTLGLPEKIQWIDTPVALRERYQYFTEAKMERLRKEGYTTFFSSLEEGVKLTIERLQRSS